MEQVQHVGIDFRADGADRQRQRVVEVELTRPRLERLILVQGARLIRIDACGRQVIREGVRIERCAGTTWRSRCGNC